MYLSACDWMHGSQPTIKQTTTKTHQIRSDQQTLSIHLIELSSTCACIYLCAEKLLCYTEHTPNTRRQTSATVFANFYSCTHIRAHKLGDNICTQRHASCTRRQLTRTQKRYCREEREREKNANFCLACRRHHVVRARVIAILK